MLFMKKGHSDKCPISFAYRQSKAEHNSHKSNSGVEGAIFSCLGIFITDNHIERGGIYMFALGFQKLKFSVKDLTIMSRRGASEQKFLSILTIVESHRTVRHHDNN